MSLSIKQYKKKVFIELTRSKDLIDQLLFLLSNMEEDSIIEINKNRQKFMREFESFDQKATQLFNIVSTVLKSQKEAKDSIIRNTN